MLDIAIMLSGTGSTYQWIAQAIQEQRLNANIKLVVSSNANAGGVSLAKTNGHRTHVIDPKSDSHHDELNHLFQSEKVDLIVLAGYMHLWKLALSLQDKTINVHPSLIPAFCGKGMYGHYVHRAVIDKGVKFSGCTVHLVDGEYDHGSILEQRVVAVESTDTAKSLSQKVQILEKSLLLHVIQNWNYYQKASS